MGDQMSAEEFLATIATKKSTNKYSAQKTTIDGHEFASKAEARRYKDLKIMLDAGAITDLELHPVYQLVVNGVKIGRYTGDFKYRDADGQTVVEDVKSSATAKARDYPLRKKLMKALHGVVIVEVAR